MIDWTLTSSFKAHSRTRDLNSSFDAMCVSVVPALLVLMATIENSRHPKALANTAKHLVFTHCGELNLYGTVEAQVGTVEHELFAHVL